jgi:hypothetical protein
MSTLVMLVVVFAIYLLLMTGYLLVRNRRRPVIQPVAPAPVQEAAPAPAPTAAMRFSLPGMPPKRSPSAPRSWAAVERKLEAPVRAARGSMPPRLSANRFDDVATTGLPIVRPRDEQSSREDDAAQLSTN